MTTVDNQINKNLLKRRFAKALSSYDSNAFVQKEMAQRLISTLQKHTVSPIESVFEIGTGSGLVTQKLHETFSIKNYYGNDLVEDAFEEVNRKIGSKTFKKFIAGDIEKVDLPENIELIISGATLQWINNLNNLLSKLCKPLQPNGLIAFSTFGPNNYKELKQMGQDGLPYLSLLELSHLVPTELKVIEAFEWLHTITFDNPFQILQHIKKTGVNGTTSKIWTKRDLLKFDENYHSLFPNQPVKLTYHPIIMILKRK